MRIALAFVLVVALAGCGGDDEEAGSTAPVTVTETATVTTTGTVTEPAVECSTAGLRLTLPDQELPAAVAEVRQRVFDAAVACDYETLEEIALEQGEGFTFSYGAVGVGGRVLARARGGGRRGARAEADAGARDDPDDALHAERERLVRLADGVPGVADRRRLAGDRRCRALHARSRSSR